MVQPSSSHVSSSPLGPTLANSFLCFQAKRCSDKCPEEFKPVKYGDDIFVLFRKEEHLKLLQFVPQKY